MRLGDFNPKKFVIHDVMKHMIFIIDYFNLRKCIDDGEICIYDAKGFSFRHLMNMITNVSHIRTFIRYELVSPIRAKQNHIINCSPEIIKLIKLIRPFLRKELIETFHLHSSGYETLHEFVPKEYLPTDYGGTAGCLEDYFEKTFSEIGDLREYFLNDKNFF